MATVVIVDDQVHVPGNTLPHVPVVLMHHSCVKGVAFDTVMHS